MLGTWKGGVAEVGDGVDSIWSAGGTGVGGDEVGVFVLPDDEAAVELGGTGLYVDGC